MESIPVQTRIEIIKKALPTHITDCVANHHGSVPHELDLWQQEQFWLLLSLAYRHGIGDGISQAHQIIAEMKNESR